VIETASDVSDVESRLMALTDQLQRRQSEAQRLKLEHKRISKEKLKAQESALIKQIEVSTNSMQFIAMIYNRKILGVVQIADFVSFISFP
jgi:hypothetical protein